MITILHLIRINLQIILHPAANFGYCSSTAIHSWYANHTQLLCFSKLLLYQKASKPIIPGQGCILILFHFHFPWIFRSFLPSSQTRVTSSKSFTSWLFRHHSTFNLKFKPVFLLILKHCCSAFWVRVTLVQQMPSLLGCHLILRNIKSIIMFHLLWDIYLCFDQITKNIQITNTHICGGKTWGREIINAPWGHWWFLSLYGCCRDRDVWWWNVGFPNHLALDWLWAKRTLWIRCRVGGWHFETLLFSILGQSDPGPTDCLDVIWS